MTATANVTPTMSRIDAVRVGSGTDFSDGAPSFGARSLRARDLGARDRGAQSARASEVQPRLRLTKRGRVVFGGLATVLVAAALGIAAAFAAPGAIANGAVSSQEFPYVLVQSGDSLWSIATELDPAGDPRDVVSEIMRLNQLQGAELRAGDAVAVPLRFEGNDATVPASEL